MSQTLKLDGFDTLKDLFGYKAKEDAIKDYDYAMRPEGEESIGRLPTANSRDNEHSQSRTAKEKRKHEFYLMIEEARRNLLRQLEALQQELDRLIVERNGIIDQIKATKYLLETYLATGELELGPDGYPTDPDARKAIMEWESRTGQQFDPYADDVENTIQAIIADLSAQRTQINFEIDRTNNEIGVVINQINDLDELQSKYETGLLTDADIDYEIQCLEVLENEEEYTLQLDTSVIATTKFAP